MRPTAYYLTLLLASLLCMALPGQDPLGQKGPHMDVEVAFAPAMARPGEKVTLEFRVSVHEGWHVYGKLQDEGAPSLELGKTSLEKVGAFQLPAGELHEDFGIKSYWVLGKATFKQEFKVPANAAEGKLELGGHLVYLPCTESMCADEYREPFTAALTVLGQAPAPAPAPGEQG